MSASSKLWGWIHEPLPVLRLELMRIAAPLAILGFMSSRLTHADEWVGERGFHVPDLGGDWRQPLYVPPLPDALAWGLAVVMVVSGLACAAGFWTRRSGLVFAATLAFVAVDDRLAAFTVSKMSPVVILAIALGPSGTRLGVDAWRKPHKAGKRAKRVRPMASVRFLQLLPVVIYSSSGIAKAHGDWMKTSWVLWSHLHDSYQTGIAFFLASHLPAFAWPVLQWPVFVFEIGAPVWFGLSRTRTLAFLYGVAMHVLIGLMFGPVVWFALLMITMLVGGYAPDRWFSGMDRLAERMERRPTEANAPADDEADEGEAA